MRDENDWKKYQDFYNEGNSWRDVTKKFGVYNNTIQTAVKKGYLTSRDRGVAVSIALGGDGNVRKQAICLNCFNEYVYAIHKTCGKYCSISCFHEHQWTCKTIPKILRGEASHNTVRKYLLLECGCCSECGLGSEWNKKPISLHMDHKDGNSDNNADLYSLYRSYPFANGNSDTIVEHFQERSRRNIHMLNHRQK